MDSREPRGEDALEAQYEWVPDPDWRIGGNLRTCRMLRCQNDAVAALRRTDRRNHRGIWWHYCADHLYGRRIINGVVHYRRVPTTQEERP